MEENESLEHQPVLHHAHSKPTIPGDLYDTIFTSGALGDWYWAEVEIDGEAHRALHVLVPDLVGRGQGELADRDLELLQVFTSRQPDDWSQPGPVDAWDGDLEEPTLSPSILIPGGWHGYFERGRLRDA